MVRYCPIKVCKPPFSYLCILKTFKRRNNGTYTFANFGILVVYQCAKGIFDNGLPIGLWNFYFIILIEVSIFLYSKIQE